MILSSLSTISSLGFSPYGTAAALRAGIARFGELIYNDKTGSSVIGSMISGVPAEIRGRDRLKALMTLAFKAVPRGLAKTLAWSRMPMIVCLPEEARPGPRLHESWVRECLPDGDRYAPARITFVEGGPAGAFAAIEQARRLLASTDAPGCLILAVDSLIDARVLAWLEREQRLKTSQQSDGIIPGEAACLTIAVRRPVIPTGVVVLGLGVAHEEATVLNERPFLGQGMAEALCAALNEARIEMHDVDFRISDVGGESYYFEEVVLAQTRLMRRTRTSQPLWHPADCLGDCGAAAGLLQFVWTEQAFARGYAPGTIAALHGSSAFGARAAAIVTASQGAKQR